MLAAANHAASLDIRERLAAGELDARLAGRELVCVGMGQSMGGYLLTLQQAAHGSFAAVAMLGWSAIHEAVPAVPPGSEPATATGRHPLTFAFHFDDEDPLLVERDMVDFPERSSPFPRWAAAAIPPWAYLLPEPGIVAAEAAAISTPVFVGMGERDFCGDPRAEPLGYPSSCDVTVYVLERSAHMHNFATTRRQLWSRLRRWIEGLA